MSSDKLASVNEPLLNLDLGLIGENGSEHISVELKKADLQRLITSMEAANKVNILFHIIMSYISPILGDYFQYVYHELFAIMKVYLWSFMIYVCERSQIVY